MKKSLRAAIPTGISLAVAILVIGGFVESSLQDTALKGAGSDRVYVNSVEWTPEGNVCFIGWQWQPQRGHVGWYYDETLSRPARLRNEDRVPWSMLVSAEIRPIRPEDVDPLAGKILLLATDPWRLESDVMRMLWWNGFAGQLEEYDLCSSRRLASRGAQEGAALAPAKPTGQLKPARVMESDLSPAHSGSAFLVTKGDIQRVRLPLKTIDTIFTAPGGQTITGTGLAISYEHQPTFTREVVGLFVRYGDTFCQLDQTGNQKTCFVLPEGARTGIMTVCLLKDDKFGFRVWPSQRDRLKNKPSVFLLVDRDGKVLRRVDVDIDAVNRKLHGPPPPTRVVAPSLLPPIPVLMTTPALVQTSLLMLLAVILVVWHQKRTGQTGWRRILWPVFVAVSSVFGFACYWVAHRDDVAEPCPGCGRKRPVNLAHCPHCGAAWPGWKPLGIEISEGIPSPGSA